MCPGGLGAARRVAEGRLGKGSSRGEGSVGACFADGQLGNVRVQRCNSLQENGSISQLALGTREVVPITATCGVSVRIKDWLK